MWDKTPRKSHMPCSARRQLKPVLLPLEPPGRSSNRPENQLRRMRLWRRECADGVMVVTATGEEEHVAVSCRTAITPMFVMSYSQLCAVECLGLRALKITSRDISHNKNPTPHSNSVSPLRMLPPCIPAVCLARSEPSTLGFSIRCFSYPPAHAVAGAHWRSST